MNETGMLVLLNGPEKDTVFKLGKRSLSIGRDKGNLVQLVGQGISRRHVMVRWTAAGYKLTDLNSTNGTLVNDHKVAESVVLATGDVISIGELEIQFVPDSPDARDATFTRPKELFGRVQARTEALNAVQEVPDEEPEDLAPPPPDYGRVVSVERRRRKDTSEFEFSLVEMTLDDNYLGIAAEMIADHVAPDRILFLRMKQPRKLKVIASHYRPSLRPEERSAPPNVKLLNQAITEHRSVLDNYLPPPAREGPSVGTAAAVCFAGHDGVVYVDTLNHQKKFFLGSDIKLLEQIAEAISDRLRG